jgi:hypothetical protein
MVAVMTWREIQTAWSKNKDDGAPLGRFLAYLGARLAEGLWPDHKPWRGLVVAECLRRHRERITEGPHSALERPELCIQGLVAQAGQVASLLVT